MNEAEITRYIEETFSGVDVVVASRENGAPELAWGDSFFSYDPGRDLPADRRPPFATIVTKDYGGFDAASGLDREGVFRLNVGVGKETFAALFGREGHDAHDFAALDRIMPHPVYGRMYWVCVLCPSVATFEAVRPLLDEAYERAAGRR